MTIRKKNILVSLGAVLLAILCKVFQFNYLPKKYFYDSEHILAVMNGSNLTDQSYSFTASFYNCINIFRFNNVYSWSIYLTAIATLIIMLFFLLHKKEYSVKQYVFIFASLALLNIYVFNLSKEIIQLIIFLVVFGIISNKHISRDSIKIILCCLIFVFESIFFRIYYLILAAMLPIIYLCFKKQKTEKIKIYKVIIVIIMAFFAITFVAGLITPTGLSSILNARSSVSDVRLAMHDKDANTMIVEVFGRNENFGIFCLNYLLDFLRLMFPLELVIKGLKYCPFVVYQLYLTLLLFKSIRRNEERRLLIHSVVLGFVCISAIFEPDFGSFVRHQATLVVFYAALLEKGLLQTKK